MSDRLSFFLESHGVESAPIKKIFKEGVDTFEKLKNLSDEKIESIIIHPEAKKGLKAARDALNNLSS